MSSTLTPSPEIFPTSSPKRLLTNELCTMLQGAKMTQYFTGDGYTFLLEMGA